MTALSELVTRTYRDLADEAKNVFTELQVEDFIRAGIAELNRVAPTDAYDDITFVEGQSEYPTTVVQPYSVDLRQNGQNVAVFLRTDDGEQVTYGYNHRVVGDGGSIEIARSWVDKWVAMDEQTPTLRLYGYVNRPLPYKTETDPGPPPVYDDPEVPLGGEEEFSVREFAKSQGFDMLTHDRSLFGQWQGQTNNTDVSPVMMMNMAAQARQDWERRKRQITVTRRYW